MTWRPSVAVRAALAAALPIALLMAVIAVFHAASIARDNVTDAEDQLEIAVGQVDDGYRRGRDLASAALSPPVADAVLVLRDGQVESRTGPLTVPPAEVEPGGRPAPFQIGDDRYLGFRSIPEPVDGIEIVLAVPAPGPAAALASNLWRYVAVGLAAIVVGAAMVGFAVKRAMRRVEDLREQVGDIEVGTEASHVEVPAGGDELTRLGTTLNSMVDRIRASSERLEGFAGDTAHELRNPLTAIRSNLDLVRDATDPTVRQAAARRAVREVERCSRLVDSLLVVATLERGEQVGEDGPVGCAIDEVIFSVVEGVEQTSPMIAFDTTEVEAARACIASTHLSIVMSNLLDNAARHAMSTVRSVSTVSEEHVVIWVSDDGPGIPAESRELIFERFRTGDEDRHFGLGLPLARRLVERAGGTLLATDPDHLGGARFVVEFPPSELCD